MKLKELRNQKKETQTDLAIYLNVAKSTIAGYELGTAEPKIDTLIKIADYYGVSLDYLCDHETKGIATLPYLSNEDEEAISLYLKLPEIKKIYIRGQLKALSI